MGNVFITKRPSPEYKFREMGASKASRFPIANTIQLAENQFVQLDANGDLEPYQADAAGTAADRMLGIVLPSGLERTVKSDGSLATYLLGDTTLTPVPSAVVETGSFVLENFPVTGVAGGGDVGKKVYGDTTVGSDHVLTLTSLNNGKPIGVVIGYRTSTKCDVYVLSFSERLAL